MTRTMFFLVSEKIFNPESEDEFIGYQIGTKQLPKSKFIQVAFDSDSGKSIVLAQATSDAQLDWAKSQPEFLSTQYQHLILDSLLGLTNSLIAKKCMNVQYIDPETEETVRSSVYDWELANFPGRGTHSYHKAVKILGVETE